MATEIPSFMLCYWCDHHAVGYIEWVVHETAGPGGGCLVSAVYVCAEHDALIADVYSVILSDVEFS